MIELVIFDLDGTLADTIEDLGGAVNRALARRGMPTHDIGSYKRMVGNGFRTLVTRALPDTSRSEKLIAELHAEAAVDYDLHCLDLTRPYPGITELLDELSRRGSPLAVLSNKPHAQAVKVVEGLFSKVAFVVVRGETPEFPRKPDPASALDTARRAGARPGKTIYLGDSDVDMETARAAGMIALGAGWGFRGAAELAQAGARAVLASPLELLTFME
jgi:phosphoglycolate phosphatase